MTSSLISCRWDWCRSTFTSIDALDTHVKHEHIWPMKPMRKAEIALMRRMDFQSLHSSQDTGSSIISRGLITAISRGKTPAVPPTPTTPKHRENKGFDSFTVLSSPPDTSSLEELPVSPAFEGLVRQDGRAGLAAAVEMFEQTYGHKALRLPSMHRPLSQSSGSSQEVVEQQLTQEDDIELPDLQTQNNNDLVDAELRWPTDDELDMHTTEEIGNSKQPLSKENSRLGSSSESARGQNFRTGSLNVPLDINSFVLQTQAPYSSQTTGWSETQ